MDVKRLYIGGLFSGISESEIKERFSRFGDVTEVEIKNKSNDGAPEKTFAYLNIRTTDDQLNKCIGIYNKTKWKGTELKIQKAKENFLDRLKKEREEGFVKEVEESKRKKKLKSEFHDPFVNVPEVDNYVMKGVVPGTPIPGEENWVVGKYGRVLPIVHVKKKGKKSLMKVDPSKFCHNVKRMKEDALLTDDKDVDSLTWEMEEKDTEISRKRKGEFPEWQSKPKPKMKRHLKEIKSPKEQEENDPESDFEVVSVSSEVRNGFSKESFNKGDNSDSDSDSDYTSLKNPVNKPKQNLSNNKKSSSGSINSVSTLSSKDNNSFNKSGNSNVSESANEKLTLKPKLQAFKGLKSLYSENTSSVTHSVQNLENSVSLSKGQSPKTDSFKCNKSDTSQWTKPKLQEFKGTKSLYESLNIDSNISDKKESHVSTSSPVAVKTLCKSDPKKLSSGLSGSNVNVDSKKVMSKPLNKAVKDKTVKDREFTNTSESKNISLDHDSNSDSASSADTDELISRSKGKGNISQATKNKSDVSFISNSAAFNEFSSGLVGGQLKVSASSTSSSSDEEVDDSDYEEMSKRFENNKSLQLKAVQNPPVNAKSAKDRTKLQNMSVASVHGYDLFEHGIDDDDDDDDDDDSSNSEKSSDSGHIINTNGKKDVKVMSSSANGKKGVKVMSSSANEKKDVEVTSSSSSDDSEKEDKSRSLNENNLNQDVKKPLQSNKKDHNVKESLKIPNTKNHNETKESQIKNKNVKETLKDHNIKVTSTKDSNTKESQIKEKLKEKTKETNTDSASKTSQQVDKNPSLMTAKLNPAKNEKKEHTGPDANKKRLESLKQRKMENQSQKTAIKQALANVDKGNTLNKKIVFDSDSEDEVPVTVNTQSSTRKTQRSSSSSSSSSDDDSSSSDEDDSSGSEENNKSMDKKEEVKTAKKPALFEESSSDSDDSSSSSKHDDMFRIRPQFEGKSGNKLMALQSRFSNDDRFKLDERFAESSEDDDNNNDDDKTERGDNDIKMIEDTERSRTMKILQEVVGDKVILNSDKRDRKKQMFKDISALQFDPSKESHSQFEVKQEIRTKPDKNKDRKKKKDVIAEQDEPVEETPIVGKEKFYEVTDSLRQAFVQKEADDADKGKSFSLLAAFGRTDDPDDDKMDEHRDDDDRDTEMKTIVSGNKNIFPWQETRFKYDSSDTEEEGSDMDTDTESKHKRSVDDDKVKPVVFSTKKQQSFFFTEDDDRIKEGIAFFWRKEDIEVIREQWLEKRPYLIEAYRNKHKRLSRKHRINNRFKTQQRKK